MARFISLKKLTPLEGMESRAYAMKTFFVQNHLIFLAQYARREAFFVYSSSKRIVCMIS